jgi:threonine/homoserine/homoserine lactone efflux protein
LQRRLLIVVPGADWAFTISARLRGHGVLPAVSDLVVGYAAVTAVVAGGIGALVANSPAILTGPTIVGGLYLMWHGGDDVGQARYAEHAGARPDRYGLEHVRQRHRGQCN